MQTIAELKAVIGADIGGFQKGIGQVGDSLSGVGKQLAQTGVALAGLGLAAGGAFLAGAVTQAVSFEKSLKNIQAVTGASSADIAALGKTLNDIGGQSVAGPQAVADAYYDIAGGVADASVRLATLNAAIAVSEAGNADLAGTTKGLISVMNAYGFSADQAGMVSDVFTQTVGKGVGTMDEFVNAMSPLGGLANSVGVEFDDLGKMMAYMTTKGTSAAESSTQIKAAMIALQKPSAAMQAAFKKMGVESGDALIKQYGLAGALKKVQDTLGDKTAFATAIGSTEALQAATVLATDGYSDFATGFEATMNGVTEAARAVQLQSVSAQFDLLKSQFSSIAIDVGSVFLPAINAILGGVSQFISDVKTMGLGGALQKWFEAGMTWLQDNGPTLIEGALKQAVNFATNLGQWFIDNGPNIVWGFIDWLDTGLNWLREKAMPTVLEAFKAAVNFTTNIGQDIIDAAPDIAYGFGQWLTQGLIWLVTEAPTMLSQAITSLFSGTTINGDSIVASFGAVFGPDGPIFAFFEGLFGLEKGSLGPIFTDFFGAAGPLQTAVNNVMEPLENAWNTMATGLKNAFSSIGGFIEGVFNRVKTSVMAILKGMLYPLITLLKTIAIFANAIGNSDLAAMAGKAALDIEGMKADGGNVTAGKSYVVGENGAEVFTPKRSGSIVPNNQMAMAGGGGGVINIGAIYGIEDIEMFYDRLDKEKRRRNR